MKHVKAKSIIPRGKNIAVKTKERVLGDSENNRIPGEDDYGSANEYATDSIGRNSGRCVDKTIPATGRQGGRVIKKGYRRIKKSKRANFYKRKGKKAAKRTIKTATKSTRRTIKAYRQTIRTTKIAVKTTKVMVKASIKAVKLTVKGIIACAKSIVLAIKGIAGAIGAGGWVAVVVIIVIVVCVAALVASGIFLYYHLDGQDGEAKTAEMVLTGLIEAYEEEIQEIINDNPVDRIVFIPEEGLGIIQKREVVAVFKSRTVYDNFNMAGKFVMDSHNTKILDSTLRDMYFIEWDLYHEGKNGEKENKDKTVLEIRINEMQLDEIVMMYRFDSFQKDMVFMLLDGYTE